MEIKQNRRRVLPKVTRETFFQRIVKPDGCWLYDGAKEINGYGYLTNPFGTEPRYMTAHRVAWIFEHGPIPEGMLVLHKCDVRACVNPAHLFLGTDAENTADKMKKHRFVGKLQPQQVLEIRAAPPGTLGRELAQKYGVSESSICSIRRGDKWKHLL